MMFTRFALIILCFILLIYLSVLVFNVDISIKIVIISTDDNDDYKS